MIDNTVLFNFIIESNKIEGIEGVSTEELYAYKTFLNLSHITIQDLEDFVTVCQPNAVLRNIHGLNVRVGNYTPPYGGTEIQHYLELLLSRLYVDSPYDIHCEYETLHPFTDCNGRSGRVLWLWAMKTRGLNPSLGFLHTFYYQTLDNLTTRK